MECEAEQLVLRELEAGERLLWAGRPGGGIRLRRADAFMIPFSLMWGGFAAFWEVSVLRSDAPTFFRLWGIPFVLVGVYLVIGRFFWDAWRRSHTIYGVTDRRILIVSGARVRNTTTLSLRNLPAVTLSERRSGIGDVVFASNGADHVGAGGMVSRGSSVPPMFEFVSGARNVYETIRQAQSRAVS
jgi:hypothetical protein